MSFVQGQRDKKAVKARKKSLKRPRNRRNVTKISGDAPTAPSVYVN